MEKVLVLNNPYSNTSATKGIAVTPSDSTILDITRGLWIGTGGTQLTVVMANDTLPVTLTNVPGGVLLPLSIKKVMLTNTDVSDIVALY